MVINFHVTAIIYANLSYEDIMLELEIFDLKLETEWIGRNFILLEETDSTNSFILSDKNELPNGTVVFAEHQTAGRGRLNRSWISAPEQNLTFSVLITEISPLLPDIHLVNFAASIAVAESIQNLYQLPTDLKWPNDVLVRNKKISGILIESLSSGSLIKKLALGIGVNVNQTTFTGDFLIQPTSLKNELREAVSREKFLAEILNNLEQELLNLAADKQAVIDDWKSKCSALHDKITINIDSKEYDGVLDDINEQGFLLLRTPEDEIKKFTFGDIQVRG